MSQFKQIIYFPFLRFNDRFDLSFERLAIVELDDFIANYLNDKTEKDYIEKLLSSNKIMGRPNKKIKIIVDVKNTRFEPADAKTVSLIEEYKLLLFICSLSASSINIFMNSGHYMATSENFTVVYQNFRFSSEWTAYIAGKIIQIKDGGYKIGELIFEKPIHVLLNELSFDSELFSTLKACKKNKSKFYRRITRSIESVMQSYYNSDDISRELRILGLVRAFEILFDLPESSQRKMFKDKIAKYCQIENERKYRYKFEHYDKLKDDIGTIHQIWADRFYTLRNHIIHGDNIKSKDYNYKNQGHISLAIMFYVIALKRLLNELLNKVIFYDVVIYKDKKLIVDNQLGKLIIDKLGEYNVFTDSNE